MIKKNLKRVAWEPRLCWGLKNDILIILLIKGKRKINDGSDNADYDHLQKSALAVSELCQN